MLQMLIDAIKRMEGADNENSVNQRMIREFGLYNPGHLIWANQTGAVKVTLNGRDWAGWYSQSEGEAGLARQIQLDASRGHTLATFISKYAPSSENKTDSYISNIAGWLGVDANVRLSDLISGGGGAMPPTIDSFGGMDANTLANQDWGKIGIVVGGALLVYLLIS